MLLVAGLVAGGVLVLVAATAKRAPPPPPPPPQPSQGTQPTGDTTKAQPSPADQQTTPAQLANVNTGGAQRSGGAGGGGKLDPTQLGAALALALVDKAIVNESTRQVVPYVAAGVAAVAACVVAGVGGALSFFGPVGIAAAMAVVLVVGIITVSIDAIVTAVKQGDWRNLSAKLKELRDDQHDAKAAIDLYKRACVEMQLQFDEVRTTETGATRYTGYPGCPSPLTWHELKQVPARAPERVWASFGGAPEIELNVAQFSAALRKDVDDVRALGLDPSGYGIAGGVEGLTTSGGEFVRVRAGARDIRGGVFPLWWFDADYRARFNRTQPVPEYDYRAAQLKAFAVALGGTALEDWSDGGAYLGWLPGGLCYWISDRAALWLVGGRDQLPEMPAAGKGPGKYGVLYVNDGASYEVPAADYYAVQFGAPLKPRVWSQPANALGAALQQALGPPSVDPAYEQWLREKMAAGARFHVSDDPDYWPVPLTSIEASMDRWRFLHPELSVPTPNAPPPEPGTYAAHVAAGDAKQAAALGGGYVVVSADGSVSASPETLAAQRMAAAKTARNTTTAAVNVGIEAAKAKGALSVSASDSTGSTVNTSGVKRKGN